MTDKGIFQNLFHILKSDLLLVPGPFCFGNFVHYGGLGSKEKI